MGKYIKCSTELRAKIMTAFGLSAAGYWKIMRFKSASDNAIRIRQYAINEGGKLTDDDFIPNCKTTHNPDGTMTQDFGWGISLLVNVSESTIAVCKNDRIVEIHDNVTMSGWKDLTKSAQEWANNRANEIIRR